MKSKISVELEIETNGIFCGEFCVYKREADEPFVRDRSTLECGLFRYFIGYFNWMSPNGWPKDLKRCPQCLEATKGGKDE